MKPNEPLACPAVLLIIFTRPETTSRVMGAIRAAKPARLYVAADGPRLHRTGENEACMAARKVALAVDWPCEVFTLFREGNLGCRQGVSQAIDWFFENESEGIILEDDVVPVHSFFQFCAELLELYRDDTRVGMISGNNFNKLPRNETSSYYFSRLTHIWGWATWRRAWVNYDREMSRWKTFVDESGFSRLGLSAEFARHYSPTFNAVCEGRIDSWAYPWLLTGLITNSLSILSSVNLTANIGFGTEATHTMNSGSKFADLDTAEAQFPLNHPRLVLPNNRQDLATIRLEKSTVPRLRRFRLISRLKLVTNYFQAFSL